MMPSSKENNLSSQAENNRSSETEQIVQLKRLLVTLKQHYETQLQQLQSQLQQEQRQKESLQKEGERTRQQLINNQKFHEEELQALRDQQMALKDLLKKSQEELRQIKETTLAPIHPDAASNRQRVEELEKIIPYLRDRTEEANLEAEQLKEELEQAHKKVKTIERELIESQQKAEREIDMLKQLLAKQDQKDTSETGELSFPSGSLRHELESIKKTFAQECQENKALEARYIEILNEKIALEHQCKQFQLQLDHQSTNLLAFQGKWRDVEDKKRQLEIEIQNKEQEIASYRQENQELQKKLQDLSSLSQEKELLQERYEQLKEEWLDLSSRLEDALECRIEAEQRLQTFHQKKEELEKKIQDQVELTEKIEQAKNRLEEEKEKISFSLEENETRLKVAQQHLAKKVKEAALLSEKVEEQQLQLTELLQITEYQKSQLIQFQSNLDLYQKQEKRLQEQLHEALKGTESQVMKWEEKYFRMYDKWLESQALVEKLKKFEEKHHQMQSLLANLGSFMGTSLSSPSPFLVPPSEPAERRPLALDASLNEKHLPQPEERIEDRYDLFGMRPSRDKSSSETF